MSRQMHYHAGLEAERAVARAYLQDGYEFVKHRYLSASGEIDLIMRQGPEIIFVEVKKSRTHSGAAERLSAGQIARICDSARIFLSDEPAGQETEVRFDVALVNGAGEVSIVRDAFAA